MDRKNFTSLIFLAGGQGTRMGGTIAKQFRPLLGKPLALYSLEIFSRLAEIDEIIIVCNPSYHSLFLPASKPVRFAAPGNRRQDSVYNGLMAVSEQADLICVHDSARPFIEKERVLALLDAADCFGAAALAIPVSSTIKQADRKLCIQRTISRDELWEVQTPQAIRRSLFLKAYEYAKTHQIEATDDLSLIEALGKPAFLVQGSELNFKITTPFDWALAEYLCASN
jgi:2-C-methyl-D-erythritol 4-phosphate cytidylyltransferase